MNSEAVQLDYNPSINPRDPSGILPPTAPMAVSPLEKVVIGLNLVAFLAGLLLASRLPGLAASVTDGISKFIESYGFFAPAVIFVMIAPTVARFARVASGSSLIAKAFGWLAAKRIVSLLFAVLFSTVVFKLPLLPTHQVNSWSHMASAASFLGKMLVSSPYFIAIYAAIGVGLLALLFRRVDAVLGVMAHGIEEFGKYLEIVVPAFMFAVGIYIAELPRLYGNGITLENGRNIALQPLHTVFGTIPASQPLLIYVVNGLLIAMVCFLLHGLHLLLTKKLVPEFSIRRYFRHYWVRVYPLLWSTSSESVAVPMNLSLVKRYWPEVREEVRRFVMGLGLQLNLDGTLMCVVVMTATVCGVFGIQVSALELLLTLPLVFLIGYGVPGIPGELILFAAPIAAVLGVPLELVPSFAALYIALQFGLPDSFRTGHNSTDGALSAFFINHWRVGKTATLKRFWPARVAVRSPERTRKSS